MVVVMLCVRRPPILPLSRSSSRWDSHFHSYVLTLYVRLYLLWELVVFYFLVLRGYIRKVSVQLVPKYFSRNCSTDSISCSEQKKNRMKKILKQDINSKQRQEIVPFSNLKARKIKTLLSLPIHLDHNPIAAAAVDPLSLRCRCCRSCYCSCCHSTAVT